MFEKLVLDWAKERGILEQSSAEKQLAKLNEEFVELALAIAKYDYAEIKDAIGDMQVVLAIIAHMKFTNLAECQITAWDSIKDRKGVMVDGIFVKENS